MRHLTGKVEFWNLMSGDKNNCEWMMHATMRH